MRALGTDAQLNIDVMTIMFEEGDIIFICSDGLSNKVTDQQIKEILEKEITLEEKASTLIETANINGGEDNITVVILEYGDGHQAGEGQ